MTQLYTYILFKNYLFIYLAASGLGCGTQDLRCSMQDLLLGRVGFSLVVAHGLSCPVAHGILVPPPGIEPASPALEGRFLTTRPPGKSHIYILSCILFHYGLSQGDTVL